MFKIKQIPEDFIVKEKINLDLDNSGRYAYYKLTKSTYTTQKAINIISKRFRIRNKYINFSGNKDKQAVTEQYISISRGPKRELKTKDIQLEYLGRGKERINLGTHYANDFEIIIRNIKNKPELLPQYPNYFGEQRFGISQDNYKIGKLIIESKFKEACDLLPETFEYLQKKTNDYVGALGVIPKRIIWLFCHAYQSYLWNKELNKELKQYKHKTIKIIENLAIPLEKIQNKKINLKGFEKVKQIPGLELKPEPRDILMQVSSLKLSELEEDELNKGMKKIKLSFTLNKGSYATVLIKSLFQ